jgi:hypothetical protein
MAFSFFSAISAARISALSLFVMLSLSVGTAAAQTEPSRNQPKVLTQSEVDSATQSGLTAGKTAVVSGSDSVPEFEEGATESAEGRVKVNGKWERTQDVTGGGYNETKRTKADAVKAEGNMADLKALHDEEDAEIKAEGRSTTRSQAYDSTWQSYDAFQRGKQEVKDTDWEVANTAVADGRQGNVLGQAFADCQTTTTVIPGTSESTIKEQHVCEEVVQPGGENGKICDRVREYTSSPGPSVTGDKSAELYINEQQNSLQCTNTTRAEEYRDTLSSTKTSDLAITTESGGEVCRRELVAESSTQQTPQSLDSELNVDAQTGGNLCRRTLVPSQSTQVNTDSMGGTLAINNEMPGESGRSWVWAQNSTSTQTGTQNALLPIDTQAGGNLCKRTVWPTNSTSTANNSKTSKLLINTDMPSTSCTRTVWPTNGSTNAYGEQNAVLSIDNQTGGLSCTRYRWVEGGSATTPGFKDFQGYSQSPGSGGSTPAIQFAPPGVTISNLTVSVIAYTGGSTACINVGSTVKQASPENTYVQQFYNIGFGGCYAGTITFRASFNATSATKNFSVRESGNCSDPGTANCPTQWSCITSAQTTINGITVTTGDVAGLPLLYPGSSNICTTANLNRVCNGTATNSNSISIAGSVPAGATSISGFTFTVNNPQTGVSVQLTQTPSAANNWVAIFNVNRTDFSTAKQAPNIKMSWNASVPSTNTSVVDNGNCSDTGTATCPARWTCTKTAPTTINGITVTTAMAASHAPLFPGAANTCAEGRLSRTCPGSTTNRTTISIASDLPAGTTSISNFAFVVNNPQSGVSVTLVQTPSSANGWNAVFDVTRTNFTYVPVQPEIRMTWTSTYPVTNVTVADTGNCAATGTANCPAVWTCQTQAPTTINGINVTTAMASSKAPLYPGAPSTCAVGSLDRICSGTATTSLNVSIAANIPAGVSAITGFGFTVQNPQTGVTVTLTQTPSQANSWIAIFRVDRTDFTAPDQQPNVRMNWTMQVPSVAITKQSSGNITDPGTQACPTQWTCRQSAPTTINGIAVSATQAATVAPLYPAAASSCTLGTLDRVCGGTATGSTTLSIASKIPGGVTAIYNFAFTVNNPQSGVTVTLTQTPSSANGWNAIFKVDRTNFTVVPAAPQVNMTWNYDTTVTNVTVSDTGDCAAAGSPNCPATWSCTTQAPTTINGIAVSAALAQSKAPLFPGAPDTCAVGALDKVCSGTASVQTSVSIAPLLPAGTTAISNFIFTVNNPQAGVTVTLLQTPASGNSWVAIYRVDRTSWSAAPAKPLVHMEWDATSPSVAATVQDTGNCNDPGTAACPTQWTCTATAPTVSNGMTISQSLAQQFSPLYPGATNSACTKASLAKVCNGQSGMESTISIAELVTPDATEITNFAWVVNNPDPRLTVSLLEAPTLQNSWVARFNVVRTYTDGQPDPPLPNVTLTWNMQSEIKVRVRIETEGECDTGSGSGGMAAQESEPAAMPARYAVGAEPKGKDRSRMDIAAAALSFLVAPAHAQEVPSEPGTCPLEWVCTTPAPGTVDGIPLTAADLQQRGELYPGENYTCLVAEQRGVCTGQAGTNITNVSIADKIPSYVRTITNVGWSVTSGGVGVSVSLTQTPAFENGWVAVFETTRTDYTVVPTKPTVTLTWGMDGPWVPEWEISDEGNCATEGDEFCAAKWRCTREAPDPVEDCTPIVYNETYAIAPPYEDMESNLAARFPAGVTTLHNFEWSVPEARNANVSLLQEPTAANGWKARFRIHDNRTGTGGGGTGGGGGGGYHPPLQQVNLFAPDPIFLPDGEVQVRYAALDESSGRGVAEAALDFLVSPAQAMICIPDATNNCDGGGGGSTGAYAVWAKIRISFHPGDLPPAYPEPPFSDAVQQQPELFPGDGGKCLEAEKYYDCGSIWVGEECYIDADGVERCVNQPPTEEPPNTCGEYADNPNCEMVREECTAGGMNADGFCYIKSRLYECKVTTTVDDPQIHEETVCKGAESGLTPVCIDGSCYDETTRDEQGTDIGKPAAKLMIVQHQMKDIQVVGGSPGGGGYGPGGDPNVPTNPQIVKSNSLQEFFLDAIAPTALAQTTPTLPDPFAVPGGESEEEELDPSIYGGFDTLPNGMDFSNLRFFAGKKRDCMKALGGLLNCCKKTPPNQAPTFWKFLEDHLRKTSNAQGQEDTEDEDPTGAWQDMIAGGMPSQEELMNSLTSNMESLMGGGDTGGGDDTDSSIQNAYDLFKQHEIQEVKPKLAWYCDSDEFELAVGKQIGTCTHLGSFCQTRVLGMCVIKKDRYCCFNSPVTRILREQLDRTGVSDLGTAKHPHCDGITFEQMSRINLDDSDDDEIIGRMNQGEFLPNMTNMASMDFSEMEALLDGARSALGDTTRQSPSTRNEDRLGQVDTAGSYTSIESSQAGYRPGENTDPWTAHNSTVSFATVAEHTLAPGKGLQLPVDRDGDAGGEVVLRLVAGASSTGVAGRDYVIAQNPISNFNGRTSFQVNAPIGAVVGSVIYLTLEANRAAQPDANTTTVKGIDTIKITITED